MSKLGKYNPGHSPFDCFLEFCTEISHNPILPQDCNLIEEERAKLKATHEKFIEKVSKTPFIASFIIWIKGVACLHATIFEDAKVLLENGFIGIFDEDGSTWALEKAKHFDHRAVLNGIRCRRDWTILRRERLVHTYIAFVNWISDETAGYVRHLRDPDSLSTDKRKIPFSRFIQFLDALPNEKAQLVAKLLYFGEGCSLDEILSLDLSQVDFAKRSIKWSETFIEYPQHVFNDIKALSDGHSEGLLFLGRQGANLSDATVFRNFNDAARKVGLGESLGPKKLVANK